MSRQYTKLFAALLTASLMLMASSATSVAEHYEDALLAYNKGDFPIALKLFRSLAERGDTRAQNGLGRMYARGEGIPKDPDEASRWFKMATEQTDAFNSYNHGDFETALRVYRPLAEKGQVLAEYILGLMYANGQGVAESYPDALRWLEKAGDQGEAKAQFSVAVIYFKGLGIPRNYPQAFRWCKRAADQGNATAQFNLGNMYAKGEGVAQDPVTAYVMLSLAAAHGIKAAAPAKDRVAKSMSAEQVAEAEKMAREWKAKPELN